MPYSQEDKQRIEALSQQLKQDTAGFCHRHLNDEYAECAARLVDKLKRKRVVPFLQGRPEVWAAGIIYALAQINFLFDPKYDPHTSPEDIARYFRVAKTTASQRAKAIRDTLRLHYLEPEFSAPEAERRMPAYLQLRAAWEDALHEDGLPRNWHW